MGLLDWLRQRSKKKSKEALAIDEEEELLKRTGKLQNKIKELAEEEPKKKSV